MNSTTLLIMRHAKSDWNSGQQDFDRSLSKRGRDDAPRIGQWVVESGYQPSRVICSPAVRVKETISLTGKRWNLDETEINWDKSIYAASLSSLLAIVVGDLSIGQTNLLVGHNPGVTELLLYLCADRIPANAGSNLMPTSAVVVLDCDAENNLSEYGAWQIKDYMKPRLLPG